MPWPLTSSLFKKCPMHSHPSASLSCSNKAALVAVGKYCGLPRFIQHPLLFTVRKRCSHTHFDEPIDYVGEDCASVGLEKRAAAKAFPRTF